MAYSNEAQAAARLTSIFYGSTELKGALGLLFQFIFRDAPRRANGHQTPYSRPVIEIDSMARARFLDKASFQPHTSTPANIKGNYVMGDNSTGYEEAGPYAARDIESSFEQTPEGMPVEQEFRLEGTALVHNSVN